MKLYTKTGDSGYTTFLHTILSKSSSVIELIGTLDELHLHLGLCHRSVTKVPKLDTFTDLTSLEIFLQQLTRYTIYLGNWLYQLSLEKSVVSDLKDILNTLELWIDYWSDQSPPLQNFILFCELSKSARCFHQARITARKTERLFWAFRENPVVQEKLVDWKTDENFILFGKILNRLSDFCYACARGIQHKLCFPEIVCTQVYLTPPAQPPLST